MYNICIAFKVHLCEILGTSSRHVIRGHNVSAESIIEGVQATAIKANLLALKIRKRTCPGG